MHFWKNNNSKIQDKVTSLKDAIDFPYCEEIKLIVSFDRSNLGSRFFSTIQQSQAEETSFNSQLLQQCPLSSNIISDESEISICDAHILDKSSEQTNQFFLTLQEWNCIKPRVSCNKLSNWTYVFNQKLSVFYPYCVIKFLYHRINNDSKFRNSPFLLAQAVCKFKNCMKFSLWIAETPNFEGFDSLTVNINAHGFLSDEHFDHKTAYSRKISGEQRENLGREILSSSAINYHYDLFKKSNNLESAQHGNMSQLHSQSILRKIKSQHLAKKRFDNDMWQDIVITKKTYDSAIKEKVIDGCMQLISRYPIIIHMYTEEQILVLKSIAKSNLILHLDATGSVVRKIDQFQKKFLYYALTLQHPQMKISPTPLAEMLSSNHTNVEITYFLHKWIYDVKLIRIEARYLPYSNRSRF